MKEKRVEAREKGKEGKDMEAIAQQNRILKIKIKGRWRGKKENKKHQVHSYT